MKNKPQRTQSTLRLKIRNHLFLLFMLLVPLCLILSLGAWAIGSTGFNAIYTWTVGNEAHVTTPMHLDYDPVGADEAVRLGYLIKSPADTKTNSYSVLTTNSSMLLIMNSAASKSFDLPTVTSADVGRWYTFAKIGTGTLTINAKPGNYIVDSTSGGSIYNNSAVQPWANITLKLVSATQWIIVGGMGTWITQ